MIANFFKYTFLYVILPFLQRHGGQILTVVLVIALFIWWGDANAWFRSPFRATDAREAFTQQTALLVELPVSKQPLKQWRKAIYTPTLREVGGLQEWEQELEQLEVLFQETDQYADLWKTARLASALQVTSRQSAAWLHVLERYSTTVDLPKLVQALAPEHIERSTYRDQYIYTLTFQDQRWAMTEFRGLLLCSRTTLLVESSIEQLDKIEGSVYHDPTYHQVTKKLETDALHFYWHWGNLVSLTNVLTYTNPRLFTGLRRVGGWVGVAWRPFDKGFQLQGVTYPASDNVFLQALARQQAPKQSRVIELLPDNSSALLYWGWSSAQQLYEESRSTTSSDFEQYILPWLGRDMTLLYEDPSDEENAFAKNRLLFVHCLDTTLAWKYLRQYAEQYGGAQRYSYQNFEIHYLPVAAPFAPFLGTLIHPLDQPYYTFIGEYMVFANTKSTLEDWIKRFNERSILLKDSLHVSALSQLRKGSNVYALLNTSNATKFVQYLVRPELEAAILSAWKKVGVLYPIGIQWHGQEDHFRLTISADYHPIVAQRPVKAASSWQADLEAEAVIAPQPIRSHDGNYYVLVQDANHRLYLLDKNGENRWSNNLVLNRSINSTIHAVDFYSSQQVQYAFSTDSAIYVFNQEGKNLVTIPLIHRAASGLAVADYGKGPRFFIACRNGAIYGYEQNGKPLSGWQPQKNVGRIPTPMGYLDYQNQRYFIAVTKAGTCRAYKRNGTPYFLQGRLGMGLTGWGIDPSIGRIAGGNKNGRIRVLNTKGKGFSLSSVKTLKSPVQFLYADVLGDARKDYIRLDADSLAIHTYEARVDAKGRTKDVLQSKGVYSIPPANQRVVFPIQLQGQPKAYIGYWDTENGSIGLLDTKGQLQRGFPLAATSQFSVVDLFNEQGNTLIVANGSRVNTYKLK